MTVRCVPRLIKRIGAAALVCVAGAFFAPASCWAFGGTNIITNVPEPASLALTAAIVVPFALRLRRRKK